MRYLLIILVLISFCSFGNEGVFDKWVSNGETCELRFENYPSLNWDGKSELPITFHKVSALFKAWASKNLDSGEQAHATSFNLISVAPEGSTKNYWVFKVGYVVFKNKVPAKKFNRKVIVDLAGKITEPVCGL